MSRTTMSSTKRRTLGALFATVVVGLAAFGLATPASAAVAPVGTGLNQEIRNQHSSLCLDDYGFDTRPGAEVRQWSCGESTNQLWQIHDLGSGWAEIKNNYSNLCLDNFNFGSTPGSETRQWTCNGNTAQHWRITDPSVQKITYTLTRSANPSADELDAYARITDAMDRAVARYNRLNDIDRQLRVSYVPGVTTADATINGDIRFGSNRAYMQEGTALHEMSHTVGVGTANVFNRNCQNNGWVSAVPLLRAWDGPNATLNCGGGHMWPYGLNYSNEYNEQNFERHTKLVQAMLSDGM